MFQIDVKNRKPIYEQIIDNFKRLILSNVLAKDERVPSVRDMAKTLAVNPNTIQKAYRELESQGYFYTVSGQGNFIAAEDARNHLAEIEKIHSHLEKMLLELLYLGETKDNIIQFAADFLHSWEGGEVRDTSN
ncbi:MAG: GntR family transcriptional regulator [Clostridiales bacterium]|jgi:GntR family transcriptional regulator|nr:GntR family transcriptional regulator [Clostridiales bacterium]